MSKIEVAEFEPSHSKIYRVLINYKQEWKPILWFKVGSDGSIYQGIRTTKRNTVKLASKKAVNGLVNFKYDQGEEITDESLKKVSNKISFHASGQINYLNRISYGETIRKIEKQQLINFCLFRHPSLFDKVEKARKTDICINYPIEEDKPISAQVIVSPLSFYQIDTIVNADFQEVLLLPFRGLSGSKDIMLQIHLSHGISGVWPKYSGIVFRHADKAK